MVDAEDASAQDGCVFLPVGVHVAVRRLLHEDDGVWACAVRCALDVEGIGGATGNEGARAGELQASDLAEVVWCGVSRGARKLVGVPEGDCPLGRARCNVIAVV